MSSILLRNFRQHNRLVRQTFVNWQKVNYYSSDSNGDKQDSKKIVKKEPMEVQKKSSRENIKSYFFVRFFNYIQNYDKVLEKKFPSAMHIYRVFSIGVKEFFNDTKMFFKINSIVNKQGLKSLTRKEMELFNQMPKDMMKVSPVLLISALPFANYVIFPLAYMYPRTFLTSHFWSLQQRAEFQQLYIKERTAYNKKIFRKLQQNLNATVLLPCHNEFNYVLGLLGSGTHPTADDIIKIKDIFKNSPYKLDSLTSSHLTYLCKLHGIHSLYLKRVRLAEHFYAMQTMDQAIKSEGDVHNLPIDALRKSCYLRGLNPINLPNHEMIRWLREYLKVSQEISTDCISLYLHLPILLTYNHPNNWRLTHK
ncbi:hypothetical protein PVAND_006209 [Polypedilum vanderplanki]|uniref:Letm1 RBD domain-containing protein n=1 Tax=Polypedilum vanderplanki TaxID=319348 RepID=A0A9J6C3C0_POLVA|nr:hypothetical protein PVAND_006209 [Polypedilum vanderplanki]